VQERLLDAPVGEERAAVGDEPLAAVDHARGQALARGDAQLGVQALVAPEGVPVVAPAVCLRRGADEVVARQPKCSRATVLRRERVAERGGAAVGERRELEPFQDEPGALAVVAARDDLGRR